MMKAEVEMQTSWNVTCRSESVPPKHSDPLCQRGTTKWTHRPIRKELSHNSTVKQAVIWSDSQSTRADIPKEIGQDKQSRSCGNPKRKFAGNSGASSGKRCKKRLKGEPSRMENTPQSFSKSPMGLEYTLFLKNGQITATPEDGCKHMGGGSASPTNPEKGLSHKRKINI